MPTRNFSFFSNVAIATSILVGTACSTEPNSSARAHGPSVPASAVADGKQVSYDVLYVMGQMGLGGLFALSNGGRLSISQTMGHRMYTSTYVAPNGRAVERDLAALLGERLANLGQGLVNRQNSGQEHCPAKLVFDAANDGVVVGYVTECGL